MDHVIVFAAKALLVSIDTYVLLYVCYRELESWLKWKPLARRCYCRANGAVDARCARHESVERLLEMPM